MVNSVDHKPNNGFMKFARTMSSSTCAFLFLHNSNSRICMKNIAVEIPVKGPMMIELS